MTTFSIPFRLGRGAMPKDVEEWRTSEAAETALAREFWGIWRFFGVNGAEKFSSFDVGGVLEMTQPGSIVNGFARDGRALVVMGVQGGKGVRQEKLRILSPSKLGLKEGQRYRIVDLRNNRYAGPARSPAELAEVSVQLTNDDPLVLYIEPDRKGPKLVWFRGADEVTVRTGFEFKVKAVPGSPVELYVDEAGRRLQPVTSGFNRKAAGDFAVFSGTVPDDGVVKLTE